MRKIKLILIILGLIILNNREGYAQVTYENLAPAQFSGRLGIGDSIENKKEIQAKKNKKESKIETIAKTSDTKGLTYADLSLKQISKDVTGEMDTESPEILSDLSILYNSAVQKSETIKYAIYKLSNPEDNKPNESAIKRILKPIASFSSIAGTALSANP